MAWSAPASYSSAQVLAAADLNLVSANLSSLRNANDQLVKLYLDSSPSIANNTNTKLSWTTVAGSQIGAIWSGTNPTRLVAPVAGWYLVLINVEWRSNSVNLRNISLLRNSAALQLDLQSQGAVGGKSNLSAMALVQMTAAAYLEVQVFQSSGAGLTVHGGTEDRTRVAMCLLGTANAGAWPGSGPRTWSLADGNPTHTQINAEVRDPLLTLRNLNDCAAKVHRTSASQSISNNTRTAVSWQASSSTAGATPPWVVGSPTRFTAPVAGRYRIICNAKWANNNSGRRGVGWRLNGGGTNYDVQFQESNGVDTCTGLELIDLAANDYVEMIVFQDSGGSLNLVGGTEGDTSCSFSLVGTGATEPPLWTPPRSWVDGIPSGILSPAILNTEWRDHLITARNMKGAAAGAYLAEALSIQSGERAPIAWTTPGWNVGGTLSGSDLVAPVAGWYLVSANTEWSSNSNVDGVRGLGYRINDSSTNHDLQYQEGNAKQLNLSGADLIELQAGDIVRIYGYQDSGESPDLHGGNPDQTRASLSLIAAS